MKSQPTEADGRGEGRGARQERERERGGAGEGNSGVSEEASGDGRCGGGGGSRRDRRRPHDVEQLAAVEGGGEQVRGADRGFDLPDPATSRSRRPPLPSSPMQAAVLRGAQPLLPRGLRSQDLDLPLLLLPQPFPSPLRRRLRDQRPRGAVPAVYHHRVRPPRIPRPRRRSRRGVAGVLVRARHMPHRGGAGIRQVRDAEGHRATPGQCSRGSHILRYAGACARAWILGSIQDLRVPWDKGTGQGADSRSARARPWAAGCRHGWRDSRLPQGNAF